MNFLIGGVALGVGLVGGYVVGCFWGRPARKIKELEDRMELALLDIEGFLDRFTVTGDDEEEDG